VSGSVSEEELARIFEAFDVTITYDKPNRRLTLAVTITPELLPYEHRDHPDRRSRMSGIAGGTLTGHVSGLL
jgi:hypothetical protein